MKRIFPWLMILWGQFALAEAVIFPSDNPQNRLVIASNTDISSITALIREFQVIYPNVEIEYIDLQSSELYERAKSACENEGFFADIILSSGMSYQFQLANNGCARPLPDAVLNMPDWTIWSGELIGLTYEPAAMVYRADRFLDNAPQNHLELIDYIQQDPSRIARIGTYEIESSGVGKLFALADAQNSQAAARLQLRLHDGGVQSFCCTSQIIDLVADGYLDIGYNVLGSYALFRAELDPRLTVSFLNDFTPVLSRAAYISKEARTPVIAEDFISFFITPQGERVLLKNSFLFSSRRGASALSEYLDRPMPYLRPIPLDPTLLVIDE